jgi:hypothetical protein
MINFCQICGGGWKWLDTWAILGVYAPTHSKLKFKVKIGRSAPWFVWVRLLVRFSVLVPTQIKTNNSVYLDQVARDALIYRTRGEEDYVVVVNIEGLHRGTSRFAAARWSCPLPRAWSLRQTSISVTKSNQEMGSPWCIRRTCEIFSLVSPFTMLWASEC